MVRGIEGGFFGVHWSGRVLVTLVPAALVFGLLAIRAEPTAETSRSFAVLRGTYRNPLGSAFVEREGSCVLSAGIVVRLLRAGRGSRWLRAS